MKYSVIIPMFNNFSGVERRLLELHTHCITYMEDLEIIVMDDASNKIDVNFVKKKMDWWGKSYFKEGKFTYHRSSLNYGFGMNCNFGFELSSGEYVFFLSSDVVVNRDFIKPTVTLFEEDTSRLMVGGRLLSYDTGWNTFQGRVFPYLEGWFIGTKRDIFVEIGGFDRRYDKFDYEDIDLSTTAIKLGISLEELPEGIFNHYPGSSIMSIMGIEERMKKTYINKRIFMDKWSVKDE